jgi:hypothetical protein
MKTILENGARPVASLGQLSARSAVRSVDWARSFSSLTIRKSHNGLRPMCSDPDSRLCQELTGSSIARGWKNVHPKAIPGDPPMGSPRQFTPGAPASKILRARLSSLPYPQLCVSQKRRNRRNETLNQRRLTVLIAGTSCVAATQLPLVRPRTTRPYRSAGRAQRGLAMSMPLPPRPEPPQESGGKSEPEMASSPHGCL